jgi:DNA-binding MarR family transcriptional regulator
VSFDPPSLPEVDNSVMPQAADDVDRIVSAWRRQRPDLDVSPLEVLSRVTRIAKHLERVRKATFDSHNIEVWEFDVLAALRRSGEPYALSPSTLMADTMVTSGAMTNRINRLSARGLVKRRSDPIDGRRVVVALTPSGKRLVDETFADFVQRESEVLQLMSLADKKKLATLLRQLSVTIETPEN